MGSVASVVAGITDTLRLLPEHRQDGDVVFRPCSLDQLLDRCEQHLSQAELPPPLPRAWSSPPHTSTASTQGETRTDYLLSSLSTNLSYSNNLR